MELNSYLRSVYKKRLVLFGTLSIIVVQLVFMFRFYRDGFTTGVTILAALLPIAIISLFLINHHERQFSAYLSGISGLACVALLVWNFGGFHAPGPQWVSMSPLVFAAFFGKKSLPFSILFMGLCFLLFYFVPSPMVLTPEVYQEEKVLNVFLLSFITPVFAYAFVSSTEEYQRDLKDQNAKNKKLLRVLLHDISNPLTVIKFIVKKVRGDIDPRLLKKLEVNTGVITNILEEVKAYSHQQDKDQLYKEVFFADKVIEDVSNIFDEFASRKGVGLNIENLIPSDCKLKSNLGLLQSQVIYNLVSNAIKFTNVGGNVTIRANRIEGSVIFEVIDEGNGIDLSKIVNLDAEQDTVDSTLGTDGEIGNGYGLGLVMYFLKKLDGELQVQTKENEFSIEKGTLFRVILNEHIS
jgi:signal transduction histidine kinase